MNAFLEEATGVHVGRGGSLIFANIDTPEDLALLKRFWKQNDQPEPEPKDKEKEKMEVGI